MSLPTMLETMYSTPEDLADVSVALDLERQQVMITISDWDSVAVMDIVI